MTRPAVPLLLVVVLTALLAFFAAAAWTVRGYTVDDAFIYYRTARHLAEGGGVAFNPGQRVEGVSSLLWTFVLAAGSVFGVGPAGVAKGLSALCAALVMPWLAWRFCRGRWAFLAATVLLLTHGPLITWSVGGLETVLHTTLVLALFVVAADVETAPRTRLRRLVALSLLLLVSRPEGILFAGATVASELARSTPGQRKAAWTLLAWLGAGVVALTVGRWLYFGAPLPNTYCAKATGADATYRLIYGAYYIARVPWVWWLLPAAGLVGFVRPLRPAWALACVFVGCQAFFVLLAAGDWMHAERFALPVFPVLAVLVPRACVQAFAHAPSRATLATAACGCVALLQGAHFACFQAPQLLRYERNAERSTVAMGRWLRKHAPPHAAVAARDIGALAYFSGCRIIDLVGLTDPHVARTSGFHRRHLLDADWVFRQNPDYIVIDGQRSDPRRPGTAYPARALLLHPHFRAYAHMASWQCKEDYWYHLFQRRGEN